MGLVVEKGVLFIAAQYISKGKRLSRRSSHERQSLLHRRRELRVHCIQERCRPNRLLVKIVRAWRDVSRLLRINRLKRHFHASRANEVNGQRRPEPQNAWRERRLSEALHLVRLLTRQRIGRRLRNYRKAALRRRSEEWFPMLSQPGAQGDGTAFVYPCLKCETNSLLILAPMFAFAISALYLARMIFNGHNGGFEKALTDVGPRLGLFPKKSGKWFSGLKQYSNANLMV